MQSGPASQAPAGSTEVRRWIVAAVVIGLVLRIWEAAESSLWLDELHTLSHASLPTLSDVIAHVRAEVVHQPLFFGFVHLFGGWEEGATLRAIPVLSSLVLFVPVFALARTAGGGARTAALACFLLACLPYGVHYATELRPYAWLSLFGAGAAWAAFSERDSKLLRLVVFALCVAAGVLTHRAMELVVVSIGFARLFVKSRDMVPLWGLIVAGALAVLPEVPWLLDYAAKATSDRFEYQETVGGFHLRPALVKEVRALPMRLFVPVLGALGPGWALVAKLAAGVFFLLLAGLAGAWWRTRRSAESTSAPLRGLYLYGITCFGLTFALSFYRWDRLPLQYFATVAWILPIAVAQLAERWPDRSRRTLVVLLGGAALALGIAQAGGRDMEDMRGAVALARETGAKLDHPLYTGLLVQPSLFEHTLPYQAYARDLERVEPGSVPAPGTPGFERPVVVLRRGRIPLGVDPAWDPIATGRRVLSETPVDEYLAVYVFVPEGTKAR